LFAGTRAQREIRSVVGDRGLFLIYEIASPDGEDRDTWLLSWRRQNRPLWTALTPEEYEAMTAHVHAFDFPETTPGGIRWPMRPLSAGSGIVHRANGPLPDVLFSGVRCWRDDIFRTTMAAKLKQRHFTHNCPRWRTHAVCLPLFTLRPNLIWLIISQRCRRAPRNLLGKQRPHVNFKRAT
jgi:hypothetical protein